MTRRGVARHVAFTTVGGVLVVTGAALMVLPGPGLLLILAGVAVLAKQFAWAQRLYAPIRDRALAAARTSVATWFRLAWSVVAALTPVAVGVTWIVVPDLPLGGVGTGTSLIVSGMLAMALLLYALRNHRTGRPDGRTSIDGVTSATDRTDGHDPSRRP